MSQTQISLSSLNPNFLIYTVGAKGFTALPYPGENAGRNAESLKQLQAAQPACSRKAGYGYSSTFPGAPRKFYSMVVVQISSKPD